MAVQVSYPGVYIEEIPSGAHTVQTATTSSTAFVGYFSQGPMGKAVQINNFEEFTRTFGGLDPRSETSYAVYQYFTNGGGVAWVVRLGNGQQVSASLNPGITVVQPTLDKLSRQAAQAAEAAEQAAERAQGDMSDPKPAWQVAEEVADQTQKAADQTQAAAEAANAAGQELQLQLSEYEAEYGLEAESTLAAAQEAALAAAAAAAAADRAETAAREADTAAKLLQTPETFQAQGDAAKATENATGELLGQAGKNVPASAPDPAKLMADLQNAAQGGDATIPYASLGQVGKLGQNLTSALGALDKDKDEDKPAISAIQAALQVTDKTLLAGLKASLAAQTADDSAKTAESLAGSNVLTPPYAQKTDADVEKAQGAAQTVVEQAQALQNAVAAAVSAAEDESPPASLSPSGDSLTDDADAILQTARLAVAWAQVAATGSEWLVSSAIEAGEVTNAGFSDAARSAAKACATAASAGEELGASPPTDVANLEDAAKTFQAAAAKSPFVSDLSAAQSGVETAAKDAGEALSQLTTGGGSPADDLIDETADWAATTLAARLAGRVTLDLQTAVEPFDEVEDAILGASQAAAEAAAKAKIAAAKARVADMAAAQDEAAAEGSMLEVEAANPGVWGNALQVTVTSQPDFRFTLKVDQMGIRGGRPQAVQSETYGGLTLADAQAATYAPAVVNDASKLVTINYVGPNVQGAFPEPTQMPMGLTGGKNGGPPQANNLFPVQESDGPGLEAPLNAIAPNVFNILSIPDAADYSANAMSSTLTQAQDYVAAKHAFLIVDIPKSVDSVDKMQSWMQTYSSAAAYNAAVYYPRLMMPDPLQNYRLRNVGPSGTLAGIYARNDLNYGVWTSPAGTTAVIEGAQLANGMNDHENGTLNELGVNCLRNFAVYGNLVWGGRTMAGADLIDSEWKYLNVRRLADFIEQSLYQSLKWVVFQDNDSRLWAQIRTEVGSFMSSLFTQGAFAGASANQAYLVKCDSSTTTPTDQANGVVNILVGFAPEKPAEFVILQLEQLAGQSPS